MKKIAIIGAGPAGLAAAAALSKDEKNLIYIFDKGKIAQRRDHKDSEDLGTGIGGAGLFSDGKISFFPSGSKLYQSLDYDLLLKSHNWLENELKEAKIESHPFPNEIPTETSTYDNFISKSYPSIYASLEQRLYLIDNITKKMRNTNIYSNFEVKNIIKAGKQYEIKGIDLSNNKSMNVEVDRIVLGIGRLGGIEKLIPNIKLNPMRFEFGVRIETDGTPKFFKEKNNDIKKIWSFSDGLEIRTFCTCRNGEIYNISYGDISALSGRSDGQVTSFSNFGFLIRFAGDRLADGQKIWKQLLNREEIKSGNCFWQPLQEFMEKAFTRGVSSQSKKGDVPNIKETTKTMFDVSNRPWYPKEKFINADLTKIFGTQFTDIFSNSLKKLIELDNGFLNSNAVIIFPCIEGIGFYPETNKHLESVSHKNIWFAGDNVGSFRGIVPAFLSGYYVGEVILKS